MNEVSMKLSQIEVRGQHRVTLELSPLLPTHHLLKFVCQRCGVWHGTYIDNHIVAHPDLWPVEKIGNYFPENCYENTQPQSNQKERRLPAKRQHEIREEGGKGSQGLGPRWREGGTRSPQGQSAQQNAPKKEVVERLTLFE